MSSTLVFYERRRRRASRTFSADLFQAIEDDDLTASPGIKGVDDIDRRPTKIEDRSTIDEKRWSTKIDAADDDRGRSTTIDDDRQRLTTEDDDDDQRRPTTPAQQRRGDDNGEVVNVGVLRAVINMSFGNDHQASRHHDLW
jgi:hypothetical protein